MHAASLTETADSVAPMESTATLPFEASELDPPADSAAPQEESCEPAPADAEEAAEQKKLAHPDTQHLTRLASVVEAVLFTSQKPVSVKELMQILRAAAAANPEHPEAQLLGKVKEPALRAAVEQLQEAYTATGRSFAIREAATGWQLVSRAEFALWLRQLFPENRPARLSAPALETLAIIAYRQPITRADLEAVRGVSVDGVMQTLLDRSLIKIAGRADIPGRPLLYETTQHFMEHFGLRDLSELPNAQELRRVPLPKGKEAKEVPPADSSPPPVSDTQKANTHPSVPPEVSPADPQQHPPATDAAAQNTSSETSAPSAATDPSLPS